MKTIILGFSNADAKGPAKLIAGPEVGANEQLHLITGLKMSNQYPDGIVRVEFCEIITRQVGISRGQSTSTKEGKKKS